MIDEIDECYRPRRQTERRAQGRARDPGIERVADERGRRQLRAILENIVAGDPAENRPEARIAPVAHVKIDAIRPAYSEIALAQVQYVANLRHCGESVEEGHGIADSSRDLLIGWIAKNERSKGGVGEDERAEARGRTDHIAIFDVVEGGARRQ